MAADSAEKALDAVFTELLEVSLLPGDAIQEAIGGNVPMGEEGTWLLSVRDTMDYVTHPPTHPTSSALDVLIVCQLSALTLEGIISGRPVTALTRVAGAIREKLETESANNTFRTVTDRPGLEVKYVRGEPLFAEELEFGAVEIELRIEGYED